MQLVSLGAQFSYEEGHVDISADMKPLHHSKRGDLIKTKPVFFSLVMSSHLLPSSSEAMFRLQAQVVVFFNRFCSYTYTYICFFNDCVNQVDCDLFNSDLGHFHMQSSIRYRSVFFQCNLSMKSYWTSCDFYVTLDRLAGVTLKTNVEGWM